MILTHTYTKTYALLSAWASTTPHDRAVCGDPCTKPHVHPWDECAAPGCDELLLPREECYAVTQLPNNGDRLPWVCWRHVRPDQGPVQI